MALSPGHVIIKPQACVNLSKQCGEAMKNNAEPGIRTPSHEEKRSMSILPAHPSPLDGAYTVRYLRYPGHYLRFRATAKIPSLSWPCVLFVTESSNNLFIMLAVNSLKLSDSAQNAPKSRHISIQRREYLNEVG